MQQCCQERPVHRVEPNLLLAQLAFEHRDLVTQGEDLRVLVAVTHRQQPQHRERVRDTEVRQS
jgi:hypothetical protein